MALLLVAGQAASAEETAVKVAVKKSAQLNVLVKGLRNRRGEVRVALWSDAEGFTDADAILLESVVPANPDTSLVVIDGLKPGTYALAAYHDENANGEFDQTLIGWPAEGLGFSNGAWISLLGPPSFEESAIEVRGSTETVIALRYVDGGEKRPQRKP